MIFLGNLQIIQVKTTLSLFYSLHWMIFNFIITNRSTVYENVGVFNFFVIILIWEHD